MSTERLALIKFAVAADEILRTETKSKESLAEAVRMRRKATVQAVQMGKQFAEELNLTPQQYTRRALTVLMARTNDTRQTLQARSIFCESIFIALKNNEDATLYTDNDELTVDWYGHRGSLKLSPLVQNWLMGLCLFLQKRKYQQENGVSLTHVEAMWFYRVALPNVFMWDYIPYREIALKNLCASLDGSSERHLIREHQTILTCPTRAHIKSSKIVIKWAKAVGKDSEFISELFGL